MGFEIVQGKRIAKNIDTVYSALDALGEYYYDFTVRQVPFRLGSSSTIAGSGMSISLDVYRKNIQKEMEELKTKGVVVAEDKSLQMDFVAQQKRIAYCPQAILFDEKVSSGEQVSRQRTRWLNSYFRHSNDAIGLLFRGVRLFNWNIFYFALMILFPPMSVLMLSSLFLLGLNLIFLPKLALILGISIGIFGLSFILALLQNATPAAVMKVLPQIPLFIARQMGGLLNIRKANKDFMATSHNYIIEIDELWQKRKPEFKKWITT
jgi:cellulose synthase/poly-beta-1,6-N-acetylglucosamine synthase-like glycosyltransferase